MGTEQQIAIRCGRCGRNLPYHEKLAGKTVKCPNCMAPVEFPVFSTPSHRNRSTIVLAICIVSGVLSITIVAAVFFAKTRHGNKPVEHVHIQPEASHVTAGLGFSLAEFKEDVPIGSLWTLVDDELRDDGTVFYQVSSQTMFVVAQGPPGDVNSISAIISLDSGAGATLVRFGIVSLILGKYSNWSDNEIAVAFAALINGEQDSFRQRRNGQDMTMSLVETHGVIVYVIDVSASKQSALSVSELLRAGDWPAPANELYGMHEGDGLVWNGDFSFRNVRRSNGRFVGEIANDSQDDISVAVFQMSIYDQQRALLGESEIIIDHIKAGAKKSFDTYFTSGAAASFYKIEFKNAIVDQRT